VGDFFPYSQKTLGFDKPVTVIFQSDKRNSSKALGKTAHYDPTNFEVVLYVDGRHPKDIMRSLSHELVHHAQNCRGDFQGACETEVGYAQRDPHLRKMEREAYTKGNLIFRDYEDLIKTGKKEVDIDFSKSGEPKMSLHEWKNKELNMLLMKKWGLLKEGTSYRKDDDWGKSPAAFTGTEKEEEKAAADVKDEKGLEEEAGHPGQSCAEAHPGEDHPMEEAAVDVARSRGQLHKTIPLDDEPEESPSHDIDLRRRTKGGWESEVPKPGVRVTDPKHLSRTTAKLPAVKVREGSHKISVREAKELTRRIIERVKKEVR